MKNKTIYILLFIMIFILISCDSSYKVDQINAYDYYNNEKLMIQFKTTAYGDNQSETAFKYKKDITSLFNKITSNVNDNDKIRTKLIEEKYILISKIKNDEEHLFLVSKFIEKNDQNTMYFISSLEVMVQDTSKNKINQKIFLPYYFFDDPEVSHISPYLDIKTKYKVTSDKDEFIEFYRNHSTYNIEIESEGFCLGEIKDRVDDTEYLKYRIRFVFIELNETVYLEVFFD